MYYRFYNRDYVDGSYQISFDPFDGDKIIKRLALPYVPLSPHSGFVDDVTVTVDTASGAISSYMMGQSPRSYSPLEGGRYLKGSFLKTARDAIKTN